MDEKIKTWLNRKLPQNFIIASPITGSLITGVFGFLFLLLYKPLEIDNGHFSYEFAIALYCAIGAVCIFCMIRLIKRLDKFQNADHWDIRKEIEAIFPVIFITGIVIYFAGFIVEESLSSRWDIIVFFKSIVKTFQVFGIPFLFFTSLNLHVLFRTQTNNLDMDEPVTSLKYELIELDTPLKNEDIHFHPDELIYAHSEGNYVRFVLNRDDKPHKEMIRCTLNKVEEQLADYPFLFRTHRKYIVNLNKVENVSGNSLGYQLQIPFTDKKIPVARSRTGDFKKLI